MIPENFRRFTLHAVPMVVIVVVVLVPLPLLTHYTISVGQTKKPFDLLTALEGVWIIYSSLGALLALLTPAFRRSSAKRRAAELLRIKNEIEGDVGQELIAHGAEEEYAQNARETYEESKARVAADDVFYSRLATSIEWAGLILLAIGTTMGVVSYLHLHS